MDLEAKSIVEKLLQDRTKVEEKQAILKEKLEDYIKALNGVASTPNGQFFLKQLVDFSEIFKVDNGSDTIKLIKSEGRKSVYLTIIRPYLETEFRQAIENQQ